MNKEEMKTLKLVQQLFEEAVGLLYEYYSQEGPPDLEERTAAFLRKLRG